MLLEDVVSLLPLAAGPNDLINPFEGDIDGARGLAGNLPAFTLIAIKWAVSAAALFSISFFFGKRIRFRGVAPILVAAVFVAPAHMLVAPLAELARIPYAQGAIQTLAISTLLYSVLLMVASSAVADFEVENFAMAVVVGALMAVFGLAVSLALGDQRFSLMIVLFAPATSVLARRAFRPWPHPSSKAPSGAGRGGKRPSRDGR
jgi:hypothetical protein